METAKSKIKFPKVCAPGGLRLKEMRFPFQRLQGREGVGEMLTIGAGKEKGVTCLGWTHC